jgi:hypothetical protein
MFEAPLVPRMHEASALCRLELEVGHVNFNTDNPMPLISEQDGLVNLYKNGRLWARGELLIEDGQCDVLILQLYA